MIPRLHARHRTAIFAAAAALSLVPNTASAQQGDVFDRFYRYIEVKNRSIEPHLPGETVDHFSGILRIVQEDLWLPGRSGLDLTLVRTYSSKIWGRTDLLAAEPLLADKEPTPVGFGWTMHMGRVRNPNASGQPSAFGGGDYPIYEAPDGTARVFYPDAGSNTQFTSRDFWKFAKNCSTAAGSGVCITTSSGRRLEFASSAQFFIGVPPVWPMTAMVDLYGNSIRVTYDDGRILEITDSWNRTVTFTYSTCGARRCLDSIVASGTGGSRRVDYSYTTYTPAQTGGAGRLALPSPGRAFLTGMRPAAGPGYTYEYGFTETVAKNQYALSALTYPYGGKTEYTYDSTSFFTGCNTVPMAVVGSRTTSGPRMRTAMWKYLYSSPSSGDYQTTTVTRPDMLSDVYRFVGFGFPSRMQQTGNVWKVGLQTSVTRAGGLEEETLDWEQGPLVAQANFGAPIYGTTCPNWAWDTEIHSPILRKRTIRRGTSRYETELSGHNQFGHPGTVTAIGEAQRSGAKPTQTTTFTYDYDAASNQLVDRVSSERICQGSATSDCYTNTRTFAAPQRRKDQETLRGVVTRFTYWPDGNLRTVENARGQTMTLGGYATGYGIPTSIDFNGAFFRTRTAYWDGSLRSETNGRGDVTSYVYDAAGRIERVTPPGANEPTAYEYSPTGDWYATTRGTGAALLRETSTLDGVGRVTATANNLAERQTREYDAFGRTIFESYAIAAGAAEVGDRVEYDGLGRQTVLSQRFVPSAHNPLAGQCAEPARCRTTVTYLAGHCTSTVADRDTGNRVTTRRCFESFGDPTQERLVGVKDGSGTDWTYAYDVAENLKTLTAPRPAGNRSFTYDTTTLFTRTETSRPAGTTTVTMRNAIGQAGTRVDERGVTTTLEYDDPLSRLTAVRYGGAAAEDVSRTYDRDMLETVSSPSGGSYRFGYDERDRVTSQTWTFQNRPYTTGYHYDRNGCLDRITYPTGTQIEQTCDAKGRPARVSRAAGATAGVIADQVAYDPGGRPSSMRYGNGRTTTTVFERGRVKSIVSAGIMSLSYAYDGVGNVTSITDAVTPANSITSATYDGVDRLLDARMSSGMLSFRYDVLGNRTTATIPRIGTTTYTYDATTNRLTASRGPLAPPVMTLAWGAAARLGSGSDGATYAYDALGRRVALTSAAAGIDVVYHYDHRGRLIAETQPNGTPIREYFYVGGELAAVDGCLTGFAGGCALRSWFHLDIVGSIVALSDAQGTVASRGVYSPWGTSPAAPAGGRHFGGRVRDEGTGFVDFGARLYASELARFVSPDPKWTRRGDPQHSNLYAFGLNNPYKYTDAGGESPLLAITTMLLSDGQAPVPAPAPAPNALIAEGKAFIADQTEVQRIWRQVLEGQMTLAQAGEKLSGTGNAYEGVTAEGRKQSKFAQEVIAEVEEFELGEEGAQALFFAMADDPVKAKAQIEIERAQHGIDIARNRMYPPPPMAPHPAGQVCSACHGGTGIYATPMGPRQQ